ncbi:hypothetical protein Agub_g7794 [Astrephomene gubernaculifera]|uniref:PLAC8 family protein n=1 Tax=Astrephomene gubernaculifera TaxID=47775 RepID=A0AAD3DUU1_9CHLO|nr:hypothetical protein Agub_g7794 [Astrephomene gubernaculifera]
MAYEDSKEGCFDFMLPKDSQLALKEAWAFAQDGMLNTEVDGTKEWDHGIFSCLNNIPLTAAVCCCPCWGSCIRYRNMEYMTGKSCEVAFVAATVTSACCLGCCHYAVVRGQFRKKYGLKGSGFTDCAFGCCLGPCALCSDTNQLMVLQGIKVPFLNLPSGAEATKTTAE